MNNLLRRPRRNRKSQVVRNLISENHVKIQDLIYPLFLMEGQKKRVEIASMPGIFRFSTDQLLKEIEESLMLGIGTFCLFPNLPESKKDKYGVESLNEKGLYLSAIKEIKKKFPESCIMTDVALDPYSSDGHDGVYEDGKILNDQTLELLGKMAVAQASAGADIVGPSDMMDGRVYKIRHDLDKNGHTDVSIMSYTAKYASSFYGPFREALDSAPRAGDKKTYQMDPANRREAMLEGSLDFAEGADFMMVKPALSYMDVIRDLSQKFPVPIAAYNVSGEYAMVKAGAEKGWIDGKRVRDEVLLSLKRAGASVILTYFAKEFALDHK